MFNLDEVDKEIIRCILINRKVHYEDIINLTGLSRMTVVKRLNKVGSVVKKLNVELIRKKGDGIYLAGDVYQLLNRVQYSKRKDNSRTDELLMLLLLSEKPITIQKLADKMYVSRTSLQNDVKIARKKLVNNRLVLKTTVKGLKISGTESNKRHIISEIVDLYWNSANDYVEKNLNVFDERWNRIFNKVYLNKILRIIRIFFREKSIEYSDYQIKDLTIHIAIMIQRVKMNHQLKKKAGSEYKQLDEAKELIERINKEFNVSMPELEQEYLNLHLSTFIKPASRNNSNRIELKLMKNFLFATIQNNRADNILISDLALHLSTTISRLKKGLAIKNPYTNEIKKNFPYSFDDAAQLAEKIQNRFEIVIPEDEIAYMALHFQNFFERKSYKNRVDVVIVCSTGLGMSRFLEQKVIETYHDKVNIVQVMSFAQFEQTRISVPLILSTINIKNYSGDVVTVSPLLEDLDKKKINIAIRKITLENKSYEIFSNLIRLDQVYVNKCPHVLSDETIIDFLGEKLIENGFAKEGVVESALKREKMASTVINGIAAPHAEVKYIIKPSISVLLSKQGIRWGDSKVNLVFFIGLNDLVADKIREIYKYFSKLICPEFVKIACKCKDSDELRALIIKYLKEVR